MPVKNDLRKVIDGKIRCGSKRHEGDRMRQIEEFCKSKTPDGLSYSCKACRTKENKELCNARYNRWRKKDPIKAMLQGIKGNAHIKGVSFNLTADDIHIPEVCPILGIPLFYSEKRTYNTPSVDRIDNNIGYEPDNIVVCSWRANSLKKDATITELHQLSEFYKTIKDKNMHEISKAFSWAYGHRIHNQTLNKEYSLDDCCICRFMHGHQADVKVFLKAETLRNGMVVDFKMLNWVKKMVDDHLDHKFIIDLNDPWLVNIINASPNYKDGKLTSFTSTQPLNTTEGRELSIKKIYVPNTEHFLGYTIDVSDLQGPEREFLESYFFVDLLPSSENLSKWFFEAVDAKMKLIDVEVSRVEWNETPKSKATYSKGQ